MAGASRSPSLYLKSLLVVALCTAFVVGFVVVLNYEATVVGGSPGPGNSTVGTTCQPASTSCEWISVSSVSLRMVNYSSELGPGSFAHISFSLSVSGPSPVSSFRLYVGNASAGTVQGPFEPGAPRVVNLTLPATVSVSTGKVYQVSVEGFYGEASGEVWASAEVTAT